MLILQKEDDVIMTLPSRSRFCRWAAVVCLAGLTQGITFAQDEEDQGDQPWNLSIATRYINRFTRFGVDISQDQPALSMEAGLAHASGWSVGAEGVYVVSTDGGYEQSSFHLGYERTLGKSLTVSGVYTYHTTRSDTLSTLAPISSTLAFGASLHVSSFTVAASYNAYFGGGTANFFQVGASTSQHVGKVTLDPEIQMSIVSQTVDVSLLPKNRGKGKGLLKQAGAATTTTTITGVGSFTVHVTVGYPLGKGFSVALTPAYMYTPTELSERTTQFIWSAALRYSADF
jgi:hypothetical protein